MLEIKDGKKILTTPVSAEDLKDIHAGDIIYLNGSMTTCRDVAHRRLVEEGRELPVDVKDAAIFHAGPIIRPLENDKFEMVSVGPTTSMRMEKFEYEFDKKLMPILLELKIIKYPIEFEIEQSKNRNFILYLILSIVTFGLFMIIWDYISKKIFFSKDELYFLENKVEKIIEEFEEKEFSENRSELN